ncbi:hypothetical protein PRIPAC_78324 [Pristionchus pacificus]|uniref:G protein-coupled receptor n=1 Tax=Pristionchus pacificus TaxID=54126 RepID=A0A2A6CLA6_PRIPA|nr:hypothetical protein PRIPAC_78324 [Pristionchus pacificus]|eukprot:PDM78857.1 G protein-coupled receptor [Pristionchus pacificus]
MSHYLLCTSFAFRLYVLVRNRLRKVGVAVTLVLVNGVNILVIISLYFEFASSDSSTIPWLDDDRLQEDIREFTIGVLEISARLTTKITLLHVTSTTPIAFTCCFFLHRRILMYLKNNKFGLSLATLMTHQMLMKALRFQLIISFIASFGALLLLLSIFEILRWTVLDYLQPAINSSVLIASPLVNLIFVKPYRQYALRSMGFPPSNVISPIALRSPTIYK